LASSLGIRRVDGTLVVTVTFGGTVFTNGMDWRANLRWFLPGGWRDQYTDVVRRFAPAFVHEFVNRTAGRQASTIELISTGHSLGGGLAQQFACAHCLDDRVPRVTKVYAFDPSPVTGFFSVKRSVRNLFFAWNPIIGHSMVRMAVRMSAAAGHLAL
jgi:pimeloyl-ACP methyl ester carboxylesterase